MLRVGKVTNLYPLEGKVKVWYEDEKNTSLPLPLLTMNGEYSMPKVGDKVFVFHLETGSSKGVVLGTYYSCNVKPKTDSGYRKDFTDTAYAVCTEETYVLYAPHIRLQCAYGEIEIEELIKRLERIEDALGLSHTL